MDQKRIIAV